MAEYADREHYIPLRKSDMLELLLRDVKMGGQTEDRDALRRLYTLTVAVFHFEYLEHLENLKSLYAPFDPDNETTDLYPATPEKKERILGEFFEGVRHLLEKANFERLSEQDLQNALASSSDWGVNMDVDFDVFERYEIWVRGDNVEKRAKRHWLFFWQTVDKPVELFKRFVLICKLKKHPRLSQLADTDSVYLKVVKDIPKLDIEMMFPGASIQMPFFQKFMLYGSMLAGGGYLLYSIAMALLRETEQLSRAGIATALLLLLGPLAALGTFALRQYTAYNTAKQKYTLLLSERQYFQTLDSNVGVLTRLLDEAEEQEVREVILGYFFLWKYAGPDGWTEPVLDDYIEDYLEKKTGLKVDFEIGDSLGKLVRLKMVTQNGDKYIAVPITKALEVLDYMWDNYFPYNQE
jgi:hypothetical protein